MRGKWLAAAAFMASLCGAVAAGAAAPASGAASGAAAPSAADAATTEIPFFPGREYIRVCTSEYTPSKPVLLRSAQG